MGWGGGGSIKLQHLFNFNDIHVERYHYFLSKYLKCISARLIVVGLQMYSNRTKMWVYKCTVDSSTAYLSM